MLTGALAGGALLDLDAAVREWCLDHRWRPVYLVARRLNHLGSARLLASVCLVVAAALGLRARSARPLLPVAAAYALSYLLVGPVKLFTDRAAPAARATDRVELFADPAGMSYPSGHVVNTFIWYLVLVMLIGAWLREHGRPPLSDRARRVLRVAPPIVVSCTVVYLTFHWVTDVLAALLLGLLVDRLLRRVPWPPPIAAEALRDKHPGLR